jgi:hypothetical protein
MQPKQIFGGAVVAFAILEILSVSLMDSWMPWAITHHPNILLKILGWYLIVQAIASCLYLFIFLANEDETCPVTEKGCRGQKLFLTAAMYGGIYICSVCRKKMHKKCYIDNGRRCPICHPDDSGGGGWGDFTKDF